MLNSHALPHYELRKGGKRTFANFQVKWTPFWSKIQFWINRVFLRLKSSFSVKEWPIYEHLKFWTFFLLRSRPGSNRGPSAYERETLRNDLIFSYFTYMISSQKSKLSNLNNFKIGGVFWKTKNISKFSYYRRFSQYNWFWGRPPRF